MDEPLIVKVVKRYHPEWSPPRDTGKAWLPTRCPFHGDERASAAVSYELDAYRCLACPVKGNAVTLLKTQEGVSYSEAKQIAAGLSAGSDVAVPPEPRRKPGRRVFEDSRAVPEQREGGEVPAGLRRRSAAWP